MCLSKNVFKYNAVCFFEGWFYFSATEFNGLLRWKQGDSKAEFICCFEDEFALKDNLHSHAILHEGKIYFIPFNGSGISIYDVAAQHMDFVSITGDKGTKAQISNALIKDNNLYLIPYNNVCNFKIFNIKNNDLTSWNEISECINGIGIRYSCDVFGAVLKENEIMISVFDTGYVLKYNLVNKNMKKLYFENCKMGNISIVEEECYLTTLDGNVYKLYENGDLNLEISTETNERYFFKVCDNKDYIYAIPCFGDYIFMKKKYTSDWICMKDLMPKEYKRVAQGEPLIWGHVNVDDQLFLFPKSSNGIIMIENSKIIFSVLKIDNKMDDLKYSLIRKYMQSEERGLSVILEKEYIGLKDFISAIKEC